MNDCDAKPARMQFSLFGLFAVTTAVAIVLAVAAAGYHHSQVPIPETAVRTAHRGLFDVHIDFDLTEFESALRKGFFHMVVNDLIEDEEQYASLVERTGEFQELLCTGTKDERVASVGVLCILAKRGAPTVDGLIFATHDDNEEVRIYSLLALAELDDRSSDVIDAIERRLEDDDPEVRRTAQEVLQQIQDLR